MDFPNLKQESADFKQDVAYEVSAKYGSNRLTIEHTLKGQSFIRDMIIKDKAKFSVSLFYNDSKQRKRCTFEGNFSKNKDPIVVKQLIDNELSYPPEVSASIFAIKNTTIRVDEQSGLNSFWQEDEEYTIPEYARIAYHPTLTFDKGIGSSIINLFCEEDFKPGTLKVNVDKDAGTNDFPVTVLCAKDIHYQLSRIGPDTPQKVRNLYDVVGLAVATQIYCTVYGELAKEENKNKITNTSLKMHLEELKKNTEQGWLSDTFSPSLAATKMLPYQIKKLQDILNNE